MPGIFEGQDRMLIEGLDWNYLLNCLNIKGDEVVLVTFEGTSGEDGWCNYAVRGFAEIEEIDATSFKLHHALRSERFIPKELIKAINQREIILRMRSKVREIKSHFSFRVDLGDHRILLGPRLNSWVPDKDDPDVWWAVEIYLDERTRYMIDSRHLNEKSLLHLIRHEPSPLLVRRF